MGNTDDPSSPSDWLMARYNTNGSLDTSFGTNGIVTMQSGTGTYQSNSPSGAILYPNLGTPNDGKIAVVGYNASLSSGPLLARFKTNGSLDTSFGSGGYVPLGLSPAGVAFDSSERFVVAGTTGTGSSSDAALQRLNADGTPDSKFGSSGVVTEGLLGSSGGGTPAIYPTTGTDTADYGKIVITGSHVARFVPSTPASAPSFVITGSGSTTAGALYTVTVEATDANGNILTNYTGTVDFASFDPQAVLLQPYAFTTADQGIHAFTVILKTPGEQALFVADTSNPSMNGRVMAIQVNPGAVARLIFVDGPTSIKRGTSFVLFAQALDAYGNATSFNDTIHFSSSDRNATLPADETYLGISLGGTFVLRTKGTQTITMTDVDDPSLSGTIKIQVS